MNRIIWTCWLQGRAEAPLLVRRCIESWESKNPGWVLRCLDDMTVRLFTSLLDHIHPKASSITAASLSDVIRILLLHEFGGVWVDATSFCNRPLDDWLPDAMSEEGFFAFDAPSRSRPIASWFLAAEAGNPLVEAWCRATLDFWAGRTSTEAYFWFHDLFSHLIETDPDATGAWSRVTKISADAPHALQREDRMYRPLAEVAGQIDWATPVFKLTYRLKPIIMPESFLDRLLRTPDDDSADGVRDFPVGEPPARFASLKVSTDNLGDHIQVIAASRLMGQLGVAPGLLVDRDDELASAPVSESTGILLNGWFKRNATEWPPNRKFLPIFMGLHLRPRKCPSLLSDQSIAYFKLYEPIGCRDQFTLDLLVAKGVAGFVSNCLTLSLPRRIARPDEQIQNFVVSRTGELAARLPNVLRPWTEITHYTGEDDFASNMGRAAEMIALYRDRAKLIVTSLLHCALPAIAMGIPVIVVYPPGDGTAHASDRERFSTLATLVRVHSLDDMGAVDWNPQPIDVSADKLRLFDGVLELTKRWHLAPPPPLPLAPSARS